MMKRKKRGSKSTPVSLIHEPSALAVQCAQLLFADALETPLESPDLLLVHDVRSILGARVVAPRAPGPGDLALEDFPRAWISSYPTKILVKPREGFPCEHLEEANSFGASVEAHFRVTAELRGARDNFLSRLRPHVFALGGGTCGVHVVFARLSQGLATRASRVSLFNMSIAGRPLPDPPSVPVAVNHARANKGLLWAAAACGDVGRLALLLSLGGSTEEVDLVSGGLRASCSVMWGKSFALSIATCPSTHSRRNPRYGSRS